MGCAKVRCFILSLSTIERQVDGLMPPLEGPVILRTQWEHAVQIVVEITFLHSPSMDTVGCKSQDIDVFAP